MLVHTDRGAIISQIDQKTTRRHNRIIPWDECSTYILGRRSALVCVRRRLAFVNNLSRIFSFHIDGMFPS